MLEGKSQGFTLLWSLGFLEDPLSALGVTTLIVQKFPPGQNISQFSCSSSSVSGGGQVEALLGSALNLLCCNFLSGSWDKQESGLHLTLLSILSLPKKPDQTPGWR